jgi:hypothetical protein
VSLRTRLGWVLIAVMVGPVLAAWWVVAALGARTGDRAAQTELARADAAVVATLGQQCRLLTTTAQAVAAELGGDVGVDAVLARQVVSSVGARLPEHRIPHGDEERVDRAWPQSGGRTRCTRTRRGQRAALGNSCRVEHGIP